MVYFPSAPTSRGWEEPQAVRVFFFDVPIVQGFFSWEEVSLLKYTPTWCRIFWNTRQDDQYSNIYPRLLPASHETAVESEPRFISSYDLGPRCVPETTLYDLYRLYYSIGNSKSIDYIPVDPKQFVLFKSKLELATSRAGRQRIAYRADGHILRKN